MVTASSRVVLADGIERTAADFGPMANRAGVKQMGYTTVYANGKTTGHSHAHAQHKLEGRMVVGEDECPIRAGDAL